MGAVVEEIMSVLTSAGGSGHRVEQSKCRVHGWGSTLRPPRLEGGVAGQLARLRGGQRLRRRGRVRGGRLLHPQRLVLLRGTAPSLHGLPQGSQAMSDIPSSMPGASQLVARGVAVTCVFGAPAPCEAPHLAARSYICSQPQLYRYM